MPIAVADSITFRALAEQVVALYSPPATGRPSELGDVNKLATFLTAISEGMYPTVACGLAGFTRATLYNWQQKAGEGNLAANALLDAIEKAEAWSEYKPVQAMRKAGELPQYWASSATHLERRFPLRHARQNEEGGGAKVIVQIGARDGDVTVNVIAPEPDKPSLSLIPRNELGCGNQS